MGVSLCLTVLNERASIDELLGSLRDQTRQPDEIVVVDGGSTDGTLDRLRAWQQQGLPLIVIEAPGANISAGRNRALRAATQPICAVTDAGVRLSPNWLEDLSRPIEQGVAEVCSGFFASDPRSVWEIALGATTLPTAAEITPATFLPSSRSIAFTRAAWERVGGYPEWIDYCEDLLFDLDLKAAGYAFFWQPNAVAAFRPRTTPRAFFTQYYRYARGDGKADLWKRRHAVRYCTYAALVCGVVASVRYPFVLGLLAAGAAAYVRAPIRRIWPTLPTLKSADRIRALAWIPVIRLIGDVGKMAGYPVGVLWRIRDGGRSRSLAQRSVAPVSSEQSATVPSSGGHVARHPQAHD